MKVNILYIIEKLGMGGTEKQLLQRIHHVDRSQFRPHVCTLQQSEAYFEELDIPKLCLGFRSFTHPSVLALTAQLSRFIRRHNILIVQTFFQDPSLLGAMIKLIHRIKLIGSFRDLGFWCTPGRNA